MGGAFFGASHGLPTPSASKVDPDYTYLKILLVCLGAFGTISYNKS